jgi:hypothetical protein
MLDRPSVDASVAARPRRLRIPGWWPVYSIAIYRGSSPLALAPDPSVRTPVLTRAAVTDHYSSFVADPFMVHVDDTWHMFFETLNWVGAKKGEIAHATSRDGLSWSYQGVVLAEPFHLSYPYVFAWGSDHYMIPESCAAGAVRLYRAVCFPRRWALVTTLLSGPVHFDNSVFHWDRRWWMFTQTDYRRGTLRLFHAPEITGPWEEHPASPVVPSDRRISRPAGRVIAESGRLIRFAQDCSDGYGKSVRALEITGITSREYREVELEQAPILAGSADGWNKLGMHHVDAHQLPDGSWWACVDGWHHGIRRPREMTVWVADHLRRLASK